MFDVFGFARVMVGYRIGGNARGGGPGLIFCDGATPSPVESISAVSVQFVGIVRAKAHPRAFDTVTAAGLLIFLFGDFPFFGG